AKGRDTFQKILALRTEVEQQILGLGRRAPNARQTLKLLYSKPVIVAADLERTLGISTPTANTLIRELIQLGVLTEISGQQKGRIYAFDRYLKLFLS
ncbi:MAG: Fic family protein, partial [Candidatus Gallionella acididurans]